MNQSDKIEVGPSWFVSRRWVLVFTGVYLAVLVAFAVVADSVDELPGEVAVSEWVQSWQSSWMDAFMDGISAVGYREVAAPTTLAVVIALAFARLRMEAGVVLAATTVGYIINLGLKELIARPRPTADILRTLPELEDFAFPSGHVMHFAIFLGALAVVLPLDAARPGVRRLVYGLLGFILLATGVSRIYLGAHHLADVVAGYMFGAAVVAVFVVSWRLVMARRAGVAAEGPVPQIIE